MTPEQRERLREEGLAADEAGRRLERYGRNELPAPPREGLGVRLLRQLREPMAILLLVAAGALAPIGPMLVAERWRRVTVPLP